MVGGPNFLGNVECIVRMTILEEKDPDEKLWTKVQNLGIYPVQFLSNLCYTVRIWGSKQEHKLLVFHERWANGDIKKLHDLYCVGSHDRPPGSHPRPPIALSRFIRSPELSPIFFLDPCVASVFKVEANLSNGRDLFETTCQMLPWYGSKLFRGHIVCPHVDSDELMIRYADGDVRTDLPVWNALVKSPLAGDVLYSWRKTEIDDIAYSFGKPQDVVDIKSTAISRT